MSASTIIDTITVKQRDGYELHETTTMTDIKGRQTNICLDWDFDMSEGVVWEGGFLLGHDEPILQPFTNLEDAQRYRNDLINKYQSHQQWT